MKFPPCILLLCLCPLLPALTFQGMEQLEDPALWPPDTWETLSITLVLSPPPEDALFLYGTLTLPEGQEAGRYGAAVDEEGRACFSLNGGNLRSYEQEGCYRLGEFRLLTARGFEELEGTYVTASYAPALFRPLCQSTLLTWQNGVEVSLGAGDATLRFTCPPDSQLLPAFFYQEDCVFDGFAVGLDYQCTTHLLPADAPGLFLAPTYAGMDLSSQGFDSLWTIGDRNGDFSPGETLSLTFPLEENPVGEEEEGIPVEEALSLILFYHRLSDRLEETGLVALHPFDEDQDLQLSQTELDQGRALWEAGEVASPFLLEAIPLGNALAYGYDTGTGHYYPLLP
ncbi:MAG: hypothetical protein ACI4SG_03800 [Oligosphaeraceae bacterium]